MVNILAVIAFFCIVILIIQLVYALVKIKGFQKVLFSGIATCLIWWLTCCLIGYGTNELTTVWFCFKASVPSFTFLHCFMLHLVLIFTNSRYNRMILAVIYLPSIIFTYLGITSEFVYGAFAKIGNFWTGSPSGSILTLLFSVQYLSYYIISIALLIMFARRTQSHRLSKISIILAASLFTTILLFNIEPFLLPLISNYKSLMISPNAAIIWVTGVWYAIIHYKLFSYSANSLLETILQNVEFALFVSNSDGQIIRKNSTAETLTKYNNKPIINLKELIPVDEFGGNNKKRRCKYLLRQNGKPVLVKLSENPVRDNYGDLTMTAATGLIEGLTLFHEVYNLTKREMEVAACLLNGMTAPQISKKYGTAINTIKSQMSSLYSKTGVNSKIELIRKMEDSSVIQKPS
ncbi:MAG TPA: LuxR C-terminal-related transcriptional regulator [Spirochaetota bacterium]|nr:LuxR C-terminal-related transcriptional regulator [Spirochaetota bacterium]